MAQEGIAIHLTSHITQIHHFLPGFSLLLHVSDPSLSKILFTSNYNYLASRRIETPVAQIKSNHTLNIRGLQDGE
jgi:hypothetical protein